MNQTVKTYILFLVTAGVLQKPTTSLLNYEDTPSYQLRLLIEDTAGIAGRTYQEYIQADIYVRKNIYIFISR